MAAVGGLPEVRGTRGVSTWPLHLTKAKPTPRSSSQLRSVQKKVTHLWPWGSHLSWAEQPGRLRERASHSLSWVSVSPCVPGEACWTGLGMGAWEGNGKRKQKVTCIELLGEALSETPSIPLFFPDLIFTPTL